MLNILIVEDDITIRELLNYNLKNTYKIFEASSAEEALEFFVNPSTAAIGAEAVFPGAWRPDTVRERNIWQAMHEEWRR